MRKMPLRRELSLNTVASYSYLWDSLTPNEAIRGKQPVGVGRHSRCEMMPDISLRGRNPITYTVISREEPFPKVENTETVYECN